MKNITQKPKKLALGKGIASLLADTSSSIDVDGFDMDDFAQKSKKEITNSSVKIDNSPLEVPLSKITVNPYQPRKIFKEQDLLELANSIKVNGLIQPITVSQKDDGTFEIISGERRFRACERLGYERVPVFLKKATDRDRLVLAIIENVQRSDLNCVEEALAYYQLMDEFSLTQEEVAKKIGKERSTIANFLRILKLPRSVVDLLQKEKLSFGHAKVLAALDDRTLISELANEVVAKGMSVRDTEKKVKNQKKPSSKKTTQQVQQMESLKSSLESKTGFHFELKSKNDNSGQITIKFNNKDEFNNIYEFLMR